MKNLRKFLKENPYEVIISLIIAVALWSYVNLPNFDNQVKKFDVPITITGEADINSQGFVVTSLPRNMKTSVTVSGSRTKMQYFDESDLFAFVDVSSCNEKGNFSLPVKVRSNDNELNISRIGSKTVSLYIDKIITVDKPVKISFDGTLDTDYFIDKENIKITPENATIKVPELLSEDISEILVSIDMTGVTKSIKGSYSGIAVSKDKDEVYSDNLAFITEKIDVEIPVLKKKVVPVTIDNAPENITFTLNQETIEIASKEENLNSVTSVMGYINGYNPEKKETSYSVTVKIPEGFVSVNKDEIIAYPKKQNAE